MKHGDDPLCVPGRRPELCDVAPRSAEVGRQESLLRFCQLSHEKKCWRCWALKNQGRTSFHIAPSSEQRGLDSNGPTLAALQQSALELPGFLLSTSQRRRRKDSEGVGDQLLFYARRTLK